MLAHIDIKSILNGQLYTQFSDSLANAAANKTTLNNNGSPQKAAAAAAAASASGEHKLLNGLLSKPINADGGVMNKPSAINQQHQLLMQQQHQPLNQPNVTINQNGGVSSGPMIDSFTIKQSLTNSTNPKYSNMPSGNGGKYFTNDDFILNSGNGVLKNTNGNSATIYYNNLLNSTKSGKNLAATTTNIELNLLELILNEIDMCVESKENRERMRQMITQMHMYFSEKLNDQLAIKNKLIADFDEV